MTVKNKEQLIREAIRQFQPVFTEALTQLFQQEFKLADGDFAEEIKSQVASQEFPCIVVSLKAGAESSVVNNITIPTPLALNLSGWMLGMEPPEAVSEEVIEGLQEGTNQILGQLQAAVDGTDRQFQFENVSIKNVAGEDELSELVTGDDGEVMTYSLEVAGETYTLHHFVQGFDPVDADEESAPGDDSQASPEPEPKGTDDEDVDPGSIVDVHQAEFDTISGTNGSNGKSRNIDMLLDVELEVYVELGRKRMKIQDLLKLGKGSLVELDRSAGEPLSIFIGDKKLAEGEVVVVDDRFGIRITQLVGPKERLTGLVS
ncbi:MAG: flagellar motor switch protein FliN [Candidatus Marinimicrobia bacterium]|nr:flagellar motor switch protein FliN [Candidatus Neomarinimicrobiota bacterium]MCF7841149.1 flagellar motor switch protein FliN [Candidatus Neomarinimicrobiota bacterium]MCF7901950.1 flagellar motor switch protein FliN [Candidatus Neomarinimicrobiota bacterium]